MGIRGVVNMCDEFEGPLVEYKKYGIEEKKIPTVDHFEPTVEDLIKGVEFIENILEKGGSVFVHCRGLLSSLLMNFKLFFD